MQSIFLSHNWSDKPFARKLANDLKKAGIRAWLDEAELMVGDSLIEKIGVTILEIDYLGVILSRNSISSEWVQREVEIALTQEIEGRQVKVLPILIEDCLLPPFLRGKLYCDMSTLEKYRLNIHQILKRLGAKSGTKIQPVENEFVKLQTLLANRSWKAADYETRFVLRNAVDKSTGLSAAQDTEIADLLLPGMSEFRYTKNTLLSD